MTPYHSQYFAHDLTRRFSADNIEKLSATVAGARVDLNPHQVDAALFAFHSPLSKGALLADEVGLGKTIEAGLVIAQKWAERKRRILVITPANLRKQWHQEMAEKFFLPCKILETRSFNLERKDGADNPFLSTQHVVICSYQFARARADEVRRVPWDMVVIDEAHRLRNVYKTSNIIANALKNALSGTPKVLLTATPLQNSLLELYGLISFIDERAFGDLASFREQFANLNQDETFAALRRRLEPFCRRTLRKDVLEYISYTRRMALVEEFTPTPDEETLYELVTEYLQRENLHALPSGQRTLMTLVLQKLLASSSFAIAGALDTIHRRLQATLEEKTPQKALAEELDDDYETLDETAEEWPEISTVENTSAAERDALQKEINEIGAFLELAVSIEHNAKGQALLKGLRAAFAQAQRLGAAQKAIIFTESRRTQEYLLQVLAGSEFSEGIVLFNGSNTDARSKQIYAAWLQKHQGTDRITGSKTADMRSALVDYFRDEGRIMIATEAGAEGINLQFCSLVVNYDLPWNPQRIEQRIGRCHRYGQKHDVVVVNFLNQKNEADKRVYELLREKLHLFEGVFGASDEVLGAIENGVEFEKRISDIYQKCRTREEIQAAFDALQNELAVQIGEAMKRTHRSLIENFDVEVTEKLKMQQRKTQETLTQFEKRLMQLSRYELGACARFENDTQFQLLSTPFPETNGEIPLGTYELPRRNGEAHFYRLGHPLAEKLVEQAKNRALPPVTLAFNLSGFDGKISALNEFKNQSGWLQLSLFTVESFGQPEDHLVFAARSDKGKVLAAECARRLFDLRGEASELSDTLDEETKQWLDETTQQRIVEIEREVNERNTNFYEAEAAKLDGWAEDLKTGLEREIKEIDRQIKEARRAATAALTLSEKLEGQKRVRELENERSKKRRELFDAQDEIDAKRDAFIADIEQRLQTSTQSKTVFTIRWHLK